MIVNPLGNMHVSEDTVSELERAILSNPSIGAAYGNRLLWRLLGAGVWRLYQYVSPRASALLCVLFSLRLMDAYLAVLMGPQFRKCAPYFAFAKRRYVYLFDAWPKLHRMICECVRVLGIDILFVSSSQAARRLDPIGRCRVHWIPEGIDPAEYSHSPYQEKHIDVLEFGRKYEACHHSLRVSMEAARRVHLYQKRQGELVFPDRQSFVHGLAHSKISVCFPCSLTDPERAGDIETMTVRYLQSMVSKCLIVGHAPAEMLTLFNYNPVVELDMRNPAHHLRHLLDHYLDFVPLIERNYRTVLENHTWSHRWEEMRQLMLVHNRNH